MNRVWVERLGIAVASLVLAVVLITVLTGYFTRHDSSTVSGASEVGLRFVDQGDGRLLPGYPRPAYDSNPPTSGPHLDETVGTDDLALNDDELLTALAAGNVVILYGSRRPPSVLERLAGPVTPALALAGDAVILSRRPGTNGLIALAWTRMLTVRSAEDPLLSEFIQQRLGRGADG